jgi:hypothetical protein
MPPSQIEGVASVVMSLEDAADRAARQMRLAVDPDRGGQTHWGSYQEAHVILALEEAGQLVGPVTRRAERGRGDCTDANGQDWDVKSYRDNVRHPRFDVAVCLDDIRWEVLCGEKVIMDLERVTDPANRGALRQAVDDAGLAEHVRWHE